MITLNGHRVAYRDEGAGEVLLLIHGLGGSSASWREVVPKMSEKYRVIAPDLVGHGQSDKPYGDYSPATFVAMMRELLDTLGIRKVTVVGHSLGGALAMQFAHDHRDYCNRLILINSGGFGSEVAIALRMLSLPGVEFLLPLVAAGSAIASSGPSTVRELFSNRDRQPSPRHPRCGTRPTNATARHRRGSHRRLCGWKPCG
jgi:pimeloyl-ACP methyl ester carboxylesterase